MKTFDIDFTDQLTEQQVRYLLKSELQRNKLLVRQNRFMLFRYECLEDTMVILFAKDDGSLMHMAFERYTQAAPQYVFDEAEHQRIIGIIKQVKTNPDFPKTDAIDFLYKDGSGVRIEYTCLEDSDGQISSIVGQNVNVFQTHDRMLQTINMLNEQVRMTDAIRQTYETMIYFDLQDYSFSLIQATPEVRAASMKVNSVLQLGELFCQYYVDEEWKAGFRSFINEGTIADRLLGNRYLSYEYLTKNIGWCQARIIPADMDSRGTITKAIFTTETAAEHHRELDVLRVAAYKDGLTGLMNRVSGEKAINEALSRQQPAIYAIFDCDFFKNINDKLGHPIGDKVLIEVSKALRDTFGQEIVMRLGGDEFVVFITDRDFIGQARMTGLAQSFAPLYARLQQIRIPQYSDLHPSLSCGAVFVSAGPSHTLEEIYKLADQKLYEAKAHHNGSMACIEI